MANTDLIDELAIGLKDPTKKLRSAATYASILTNAQDDLNEEFQLLQKVDSSTLSLTASTELVGNLPSDFFAFVEEDNDNRSGQVAIGDSRDFALIPSSLSLLDHDSLGWKDTAAGTPEKFYIVPGANVELRVWPKPSASFITKYGNDVHVHYVFQPAAIAYNSDLPFNNSQRLRGLGRLLKLMATRQILIEDKEIEKAASFDALIQREQEKKKDILRSILRNPGGVGFDRRRYNA